MIKKTLTAIVGLLAAMTILLAVIAGLLATSGTARADYLFDVCPSGSTGVVTNVTSCPFADEVRYSYFIQGTPVITAFSPVTGRSYRMYCTANQIVTLIGIGKHPGVLCSGGDNAAVVFW